MTGWSYRHSRDPTGFEDGTENPPLSEAPSVATVPAGRRGAGSSIVLVQQWQHHSADWDTLGVPAQELVMGRTKAEGIELEGGFRDALTRFTTPLTGTYYVLPAVQALQAFASPVAG